MGRCYMDGGRWLRKLSWVSGKLQPRLIESPDQMDGWRWIIRGHLNLLATGSNTTWYHMDFETVVYTPRDRIMMMLSDDDDVK